MVFVLSGWMAICQELSMMMCTRNTDISDSYSELSDRTSSDMSSYEFFDMNDFIEEWFVDINDFIEDFDSLPESLSSSYTTFISVSSSPEIYGEYSFFLDDARSWPSNTSSDITLFAPNSPEIPPYNPEDTIDPAFLQLFSCASTLEELSSLNPEQFLPSPPPSSNDEALNAQLNSEPSPWILKIAATLKVHPIYSQHLNKEGSPYFTSHLSLLYFIDTSQNNEYRIVIPELSDFDSSKKRCSYQEEVISTVHQLVGYLGWRKTWNLAKKDHFWPN